MALRSLLLSMVLLSGTFAFTRHTRTISRRVTWDSTFCVIPSDSKTRWERKGDERLRYILSNWLLVYMHITDCKSAPI